MCKIGKIMVAVFPAMQLLGLAMGLLDFEPNLFGPVLLNHF
jgi:hypothetical protein